MDATERHTTRNPSSFKPNPNKNGNGYLRSHLLGIYCVIIFKLCIQTVQSFNVDIEHRVVHTGTRDSYFGFSLAQHVYQGQSWILVGAPRAETSQPGVERGGGVYRCRVDSTNCQYVPFDTYGSNNPSQEVPQRTEIERKSDQWFGASVYSSEVNGRVVACAPRYVYFSTSYRRREPVGRCLVLEGFDSFPTFPDFSPCREELDRDRNGLYRCLVGFSVCLNYDGTRLVMGAPGSYYWQGQVFSQGLTNTDVIPDSTKEAPILYDDSYMGYSITVGHFNEDSIEDYAVGVPRAEQLKGKVSVLTTDVNFLVNITGEQFGEYFGYSITTTDANGDGRDDIAVGAPLYTDYTSDAIETGRVFIFYQTTQSTFSNIEKESVYGIPKWGARFGTSVAGIGDGNNDGAGDLAVGAPYDGPDNKGAVYIFHGSDRGIRQRHAQVIYAEDMKSPLVTFGFTLTGGKDLDRNGYPDIVAGAYSADSSVFLKTRPVIDVSVATTINPSVIDVREKNCGAVSCVQVSTCFAYTGLGTPNQINLDITRKLDALKANNYRAYYTVSGSEIRTELTSRVTLRKGEDNCIESTAYLKDTIQDKLSPIHVLVNYSLVEPPPSNDLTPVLNQYRDTTQYSQVQILKNCGSDNICIPDLVLKASSKSTHIMETDSTIELVTEVENVGEDAFEAQIQIPLPPGTNYKTFKIQDSDYSVSCRLLDPETNDMVICQLGNPFPARAKVKVKIRIAPQRINGSSESILFNIHATSSNPENVTDREDNMARVHIPVKVITNIKILGVTLPEQLLYNTTVPNVIRNDTDAGPEVIHLYEIRNLGPSKIQSASLEIHWPSQLGEGQDLLYLTTVPHITEGTGHCTARLVNYRNLTISASPEGGRDVESDNKRKRRSIVDRGSSEERFVDCMKEGEWCTIIHCETGLMSKDDNVLVEIKSRLWTKTLNQLGLRGLQISSHAIGQVLEVPYNIHPEEYSMETFQIKTYAAALGSSGQSGPQLWVIVLSIVGGVILLLLLVIILWRCGFFKRTRPEDCDDLVKNGKNGHNGQMERCSKYEDVPTDEY